MFLNDPDKPDMKDQLSEVIAQHKSGGCISAQVTALAAVITIAIVYGAPVEVICKALKNIACPSLSLDHGMKNRSCADGISRIIELQFYRNGQTR